MTEVLATGVHQPGWGLASPCRGIILVELTSCALHYELNVSNSIVFKQATQVNTSLPADASRLRSISNKRSHTSRGSIRYASLGDIHRELISWSDGHNASTNWTASTHFNCSSNKSRNPISDSITPTVRMSKLWIGDFGSTEPNLWEI